MKRMIINHVTVLVLAILLAGCGAARMHYMNDGVQTQPATSPEKVQVFSDRSLPGKEYTELGYVAIHGDGDGDKLKAELRKEAASIGADAIIGFQIGGYIVDGIAIKFK